MTDQYLADPWRARALADSAVSRSAQELRDILKALATSMDPFPSFMGLATLHAVEVDPGATGNPERGCVVVGPDGELCELILRMIPGLPEVGGMDQIEELNELELEPSEYIAYAYHAIQELARIHRERLERPTP